MKLAYLILAHAHPEQIIRMVDALRPSAALFVIHIDARAPATVFEPVVRYARTVPGVHLAPRHRCYWGSCGIMRATFACIRTLLDHAPSLTEPFSYAALLSGQDYPIQPPAQLAAFFAQRPAAQFIEAFSLAQPNRWTAQAGRFQALARVLFYTFHLRSRPFHLRLKRRFPHGWEPHGGSQWWCLSREAILWIDEYLRENPSFERYFRSVFIPDESMIQTLLANSPFRDRISAETLHYIDWDRPNPRFPRTLTLEPEAAAPAHPTGDDFTRLAASPKLFARKFHPVQSRTLLDRIDRDLLQ